MEGRSSDRSDVSRSASRATRPRSRITTVEDDPRAGSRGTPSPSRTKVLVDHNNNNNDGQQQQHHLNPSSSIAGGAGGGGGGWNDDSFSDERFMSPASLPGGSWETSSQSFDSEDAITRMRISAASNTSRPSSRTSLRDRRKQFDTTTPTLIDEEDEDDDDDEEEAEITSSMGRLSVSLDDLGLRHAQQQHAQTATSFDEQAGAAAAAAAAAAMRRTPGASQMHQSATTTTTTGVPKTNTSVRSTSSSSSHHTAEESLGFGLIMSTPVASAEQEKSGKSLLWQSSSTNPSTSPSMGLKEGGGSSSTLEQQPSRPPLAPPVTREPAKGPFTFTPWPRANSPSSSAGVVGGPAAAGTAAATTTSSSAAATTSTAAAVAAAAAIANTESQHGERHGAFSPNMVRLTEDIGQLLQEDSDDDYALEIPSVFRGEENESITDFGGDWTGSYVFDANFGGGRRSLSSKHLVQRPSTVVKEGRSRRRPNSSQGTAGGSGATATSAATHEGGTSSFIPNAQAPKPTRRSGNEIFEFGKARDERASPQLLSFSGAFAPPMKDVPGSFMRPVASSAAGAVAPPPFGPPAFHHGGFQPPPPPQPISFGTSGPASSSSSAPVAVAAGLHSQSFDSYQSLGGHGGGPQLMGSFQPNRYGLSPSPIMPAPGFPYPGQPPLHQHSQQQQQQSHSSEMQATAQEFVPMSTRSTTPQFMAPAQWVPPQQPQSEQHQPPPPQQQLQQKQPPPPPQQQQQQSSQTPQQQKPPSTQQQQQQPPPHIHFDTMEQQQSWHSGATAYSYSPSFGYGIPPPSYGDARGAMTPSPHLIPWPQAPSADPSIYHNILHPQPKPAPQQAEASVAPPGNVAAPSGTSTTPQPSATTRTPTPTTTQEQQGREQKKKESRRGHRRGKKKTKADKASSGGGKKKNKGESGTSDTPTPTEEGNPDDAAASASEDPVDAKRAELVESPATKTAFKHFYRNFRVEERVSFQKAEEHALQSLEDGSLPDSVHWRVYLELADLAKRSNRYVEARRLYQKVCQLQPYASQGWLEYSKLEEECGFMNRVTNILHAGLEFCEYSESLLTRAVKHQEKLGNLDSAREILARLKHVGIDKVWRTVLEGALLEARAGNRDMARRVLKYLMHHVPWYGPLYLEAFKLERDQGHPMDALQVVEWGLTALPRYGPLWFGAFRLYEEMDVTKKEYRLPETIQMIERAKTSISKELIWKVHLEAAQMLERTALAHIQGTDSDLESYLEPVRQRLVLTILTCPDNLRWKVWLVAGRMELGVGNIDRARALFRRAHECVQRKSKSATLLDCARLEEFVGDAPLARAILCKARLDYGNDWKVWLESVLIEIRNCDYRRALSIAMNALEIHTGTGRLWATLVQLSQIIGGDEAQNAALERALSAVPKSGEVWCEGGRVHLNPFSCTFDLDRARRHLYFASKFTPQFGDSFIESLRVEILSQWLLPVAEYIWKKTKTSFLRTGDHNLTKFVTDISLAIAVARRKDSESVQAVPETQYREIVGTIRKKLKVESLRSTIDLTELRLACANADPNYGSLWSHCRRLPTDTPRRVIEHAAEDVADVLFKYAHVYLAAMVRRIAVLATSCTEKPEQSDGALETNDSDVVEWENLVDQKLRSAAPLADIFNPVDPTTGLVLLGSTVNGSVFVTGLSENQHCPVENMGFSDRRRALFGTDALFP